MYPHPNRGRQIFLYFFVAIISFLLGWQLTYYLGISPVDLGGNSDEKNGDGIVENPAASTDLTLFWKVWGLVEEKYVNEDVIDEEEMTYGAIKGMVDSLGDHYTVFMTPDETEQFADSLEGTLEGIGAELTVEEGALIIVSPLRDSPAEKAGLLPGDIIYKIEDEFAADMTLFEAVMKIRGEKGTTVLLTIIREDLDEPFEVSIVRKSIDLESVTVEELDNGIVYVSVNQFNDKTLDQFSNAISEMILDEPKGVIIDLRFNGGGYLDIAVELLSFLLPSDTEAVIIQKRATEDEILYTNGNPKILDIPLVVLVNEGSASASEIMAGALQDHDRGIIMGTQSFGKGTVQEVEFFSDGSSMRITIAKWLTPDMQDVNGVGLTPDVIVDIQDEDIENEYDRQKEEAVEYLEKL